MCFNKLWELVPYQLVPGQEERKQGWQEPMGARKRRAIQEGSWRADLAYF